MRRTATHQAACLTCYTSIIASGGKRDCEQAATGHMHAYGHQVVILTTKGTK